MNVVRITNGKLMPSTPMEYEMSNDGIQFSTNVFCIVPTSVWKHASIKSAANCAAARLKHRAMRRGRSILICYYTAAAASTSRPRPMVSQGAPQCPYSFSSCSAMIGPPSLNHNPLN